MIIPFYSHSAAIELVDKDTLLLEAKTDEDAFKAFISIEDDESKIKKLVFKNPNLLSDKLLMFIAENFVNLKSLKLNAIDLSQLDFICIADPDLKPGKRFSEAALTKFSKMRNKTKIHILVLSPKDSYYKNYLNHIEGVATQEYSKEERIVLSKKVPNLIFNDSCGKEECRKDPLLTASETLISILSSLGEIPKNYFCSGN